LNKGGKKRWNGAFFGTYSSWTLSLRHNTGKLAKPHLVNGSPRWPFEDLISIVGLTWLFLLFFFINVYDDTIPGISWDFLDSPGWH